MLKQHQKKKREESQKKIDNEDKKVLKKRGRKPKKKTPKKRVGNPSKVVSKEDLEKEDCIIAHLPINVNQKKSSQNEETSSITEISLDTVIIALIRMYLIINILHI